MKPTEAYQHAVKLVAELKKHCLENNISFLFNMFTMMEKDGKPGIGFMQAGSMQVENVCHKELEGNLHVSQMIHHASLTELITRYYNSEPGSIEEFVYGEVLRPYAEDPIILSAQAKTVVFNGSVSSGAPIDTCVFRATKAAEEVLARLAEAADSTSEGEH